MSNTTCPPKWVQQPCTPAPPYSSFGYSHADKEGALIRPTATIQGRFGFLHDYKEQSHANQMFPVTNVMHGSLLTPLSLGANATRAQSLSY